MSHPKQFISRKAVTLLETAFDQCLAIADGAIRARQYAAALAMYLTIGALVQDDAVKIGTIRALLSHLGDIAFRDGDPSSAARAFAASGTPEGVHGLLALAKEMSDDGRFVSTTRCCEVALRIAQQLKLDTGPAPFPGTLPDLVD